MSLCSNECESIEGSITVLENGLDDPHLEGLLFGECLRQNAIVGFSADERFIV